MNRIITILFKLKIILFTMHLILKAEMNNKDKFISSEEQQK